MPVYSVPRNWASSRSLAKLLQPGPRRLPVGFDSQLVFDLFQECQRGLFHRVETGSIADRGEGLFQVDPRRRPVAGGDGDAAPVEQLLPLLQHERQLFFPASVELALAGSALLGQGDIELAAQRDVVPDDKQPAAQDRHGA